MKKQFYEKYKKCYRCIINKDFDALLACSKSQELPIKYQSSSLYLCNLEFTRKLPRIFDKLFKHRKRRKK